MLAGYTCSGKRCSRGVRSIFPSGLKVEITNAAKLKTAKMAPTRRRKTKRIRLTTALNMSRFEGRERNVTKFSLLNLSCD